MRSMKLALTCGILALLLAGQPTLPISAETASTTPALPQALAPVLPKPGTGFAYDMMLTGELTISQPAGGQNVNVQKQNVSLNAGLEIRWSATSRNNIWPARLNLVAPHISVAGTSVPIKPATTQVMETTFDHSAQLLSIKTPTQLSDLGLDFTTIMMGLTVPMPGGSASVGTSWIVRNTITSVGLIYDLRTTYTLVGFEPRRGKTLAYIRGTTLYTPRDNPTRANSTGYLEAFVDPATGRVVESAYSIDVTNKVMLPSQKSSALEEVTIRTVITTLLLDLGPASAEPPAPIVPAAEPQPEPVTPEPVPVTLVGQQPGTEISVTGPIIVVAPPTTPSVPEPVEPDTEAEPTTSSELEDVAPPVVPEPVEPGTPFEPITPSEPEDVAPPVIPEPAETATPFEPTMPSAPEDVAPSVTPEPVEPAVTPKDTTPSVEPTLPGEPAQAMYVDPAGRYSFTLPLSWSAEPVQLLSDTAAFAGNSSPQMIYVFSNEVEAVGLKEFAENVLSEYGRISAQFRLIEMKETTINEQPAYAAYYTYPAAGTGRVVGEVSLFTRYQSAQYIVQYTDDPAKLAPTYQKVIASLRESLVFGPTPSGNISAADLSAAEMLLHVDKAGRYKLNVPALWPLAAQSPDGNVTTFVELAGKGYLTVYTQAGLERYTAQTVLQAWRAQWAQQEPEFRLVTDFTPVVLSNLPGVGFAYTWRNADGRTWQRSVQAVMYGGTIYAVMLDYVADMVEARSGPFAAIYSSFNIVDGTGEQPTALESTEPPPTGDVIVVTPKGRAILTGTTVVDAASTIRLEDPLSATRILLAGRLGMQQEDTINWLSNFALRLQVGASLYATQTDAEGYFMFANVAPLRSGEYALRDGEGWLPGLSQAVKLTFNDVIFPLQSERFMDLGYVIIDMRPNGIIDVIQTPPDLLANSFEVPFHLLAAYPQSGWATIIRGALLSR